MNSHHSNRQRGLMMTSFGILVFSLCVVQQAHAKPFDWSSLLPSAVDIAKDVLFVQNDMELLGHYCMYTRRGYFYKWELNYKAEVKCPGWTYIIGKARNHVNPTTAEREATKNFVEQVLAAGLITEEDAHPWLLN